MSSIKHWLNAYAPWVLLGVGAVLGGAAVYLMIGG